MLDPWKPLIEQIPKHNGFYDVFSGLGNEESGDNHYQNS